MLQLDTEQPVLPAMLPGAAPTSDAHSNASGESVAPPTPPRNTSTSSPISSESLTAVAHSLPVTHSEQRQPGAGLTFPSPSKSGQSSVRTPRLSVIAASGGNSPQQPQLMGGSPRLNSHPVGTTPPESDSASVMTTATTTAEAMLEDNILARVALIVCPPPTTPGQQVG